jgi:hemoglobin/transferrin/lactoferrin receptor protein
MKKLIYTLILFSSVLIINAQTVTITDQETGEPLEMVTLSSSKPVTSEVTNAQGQAEIARFKESSQIVISHLGYQTKTTTYIELKNDPSLSLKPTFFNLDDVVVSATKWRQSASNVPSAVATISTEEVQFQNPQTSADLLGLSGKVFIQKSQQGGGSPMIRGFATNRLIYVVDGVRMNTAIFRGGNIQNVINLDPNATESTEVLFGPGSVIYGSDAIGGAMSFQTLQPQLSLTGKTMINGKASVRYSSANNEKNGHFDINIGLKKWAFVTSVSLWDFDHLRQGKHGPDDYLKDYFVTRAFSDSIDMIVLQDNDRAQRPSAYNQINVMQKVRFSPNDQWDINYGFHYSRTSSYGRYDRHNRVRNGLPRYGEWSYGPQKWMMNNLSITHQGNNAAYDEMTLRLAHQFFEESRISRNYQSESQSTNKEQVQAYSINLDFKKSLENNNTLFYGVEYVLNDVTSTGTTTNILTDSSTAGPARYPNSSWQSIGIYVSDEFKATEKLTFLAGLRFNQFILNADFDNNLSFYPFPFSSARIDDAALTGSFGMVYRPAPTWVLKANFGTAFRSPNVDDIGKVFDSEPGSVVVPNPDLRAEYAINFDIGITKVFGETLKLYCTGFYTTLNNAMVRRNFSLNGQDSIVYDGVLSQVQAIQNAAETRVYGVQAGMELKLPAGFSLDSDINWQKGEDELDDGTISPSRHAAPLFGISRLNYRYKRLHLQLNVAYQGEISADNLPEEEKGKDEIYAKDSNGNNFAPRWYTLNFKSQYAFNEYISVSAGIENITNRRYRPYSSGISGAGTNLVVSVMAKF